MPHALRQVLSTRSARPIDGPGRAMTILALAGAGMMAAAIVLAVVDSSWALPLGVAGALVQAGGFVGAFWWVMRPPPPQGDRGRP